MFCILKNKQKVRLDVFFSVISDFHLIKIYRQMTSNCAMKVFLNTIGC